MSDGAQHERLGLSEAFDWRSARTWVAFLGSAVAVGVVTAVIVQVAAFLARALASGSPLADWAGGAVVAFVLFLVFLFFLEVLLKPKGREHNCAEPDGGSCHVAAKSKFWPSFLLETIWCGVAILPILVAIHGAPKLPHSGVTITSSEPLAIIAVMTAVLVVGIGTLYIPDFLHRWGRAKPAKS